VGAVKPGRRPSFDQEQSRIHLYGDENGPQTGIRSDALRIEGKGATGRLTLGGDGESGRLVVVNRNDKPTFQMDGGTYLYDRDNPRRSSWARPSRSARSGDGGWWYTRTSRGDCVQAREVVSANGRRGATVVRVPAG